MKIVSSPTPEMINEINIKIICLNSKEIIYRDIEIIYNYDNEIRNKYDSLFTGWHISNFKILKPKIRMQIYKEQQEFIKKYKIF